MEEEQKQDYREHLINTIDMLIDGGISVYDIDVVNKKAIRSNYILKQKVKDKIETLRKMLKATTEGKLQEYTPGEILLKIDTLKELLEDK